jgi:hypothetical protein
MRNGSLPSGLETRPPARTPHVDVSRHEHAVASGIAHLDLRSRQPVEVDVAQSLDQH